MCWEGAGPFIVPVVGNWAGQVSIVMFGVPVSEALGWYSTRASACGAHSYPPQCGAPYYDTFYNMTLYCDESFCFEELPK